MSKLCKYLMFEIFKLFLFICLLSTIIYLLQLRYKYVSNQFILLDHKSDSLKQRNANICSLYTKDLEGPVHINIHNVPTFTELNEYFKYLPPGGFSRPDKCEHREKLAIIIPYRDRPDNLLLLLKYLHPFLQKQNRYYRIFVVEQHGQETFNKGRIMNIGSLEAMKFDDFDCFIFHDVDLIPENDYNIYECFEQPRHLSPAVDELRYNLMYYNLVGGVLALSKQQLLKTNGFSNIYWGWGAEDDDMSMRIINSGFEITRPPNEIGRYKMVLHKKRSRSENRYNLLDSWSRYKYDGLTSIPQINFTIKHIEYSHLYTNITIDVGLPRIETFLSLKNGTTSQMKFKMNSKDN